MKHIELDLHFISENEVKQGQVLVNFVFAPDQLTDVMTKFLT